MFSKLKNIFHGPSDLNTDIFTKSSSDFNIKKRPKSMYAYRIKIADENINNNNEKKKMRNTSYHKKWNSALKTEIVNSNSNLNSCGNIN